MQTDSYDPNEPSADPDSVDVDKPRTWADYNAMVLAGLPKCERKRMAEAYGNLRYSQSHFDDVAQSHKGGSIPVATDTWDPLRDTSAEATKYEKSGFSLEQPVMRRIVEKLSENLYKRAPTRELGDKSVSAVLNEVYKRNDMGSKWQRSDALTAIGGAAAFQLAGLEDEKNPIKVHLLGADEISVLGVDPVDRNRPTAVVVVDKAPNERTRATLWTEETVSTYALRRTDWMSDRDDRKFELVRKRSNPYRLPNDAQEGDQGRGILPFAFTHFDPPVSEFTWNGPGDNLKQLNRYVNFGFDDLAEGVRYLTKPVGVATGVDEDWSPPAIVRPGIFLHLPAGQMDAGGNGPEPGLAYLTANNDFVPTIWSHLNQWLDLAMELWGVPPSTVRMSTGDKSGIAILTDQQPLLGWTENRRRPWAHYELDMAILVCRIISAHLRNHGYPSDTFDAAALDPAFSLRWPRLYTDLPGPERDRADGTRLQWGVASLLDLVQEREDCTREQALEQLKRVKKDNAELMAIGVEPLPAILGTSSQATPGGMQGPTTEPPAGAGPASLNAPAAGPKPITGSPNDANARADSLSSEGG